MNIPLRIKEYREVSRVEKFSLLEGIKTLLFNLRVLFTHRVLTSRKGWVRVEAGEEIVNDISLVFVDGGAKFVKTPEKVGLVALEISQRVDT